jgi:hypothetical protein
MRHLPDSAQHARAQNEVRLRNAVSTRSTPLQSHRSVGAPIKRRDEELLVRPNWYGIISEAIRNNLVLSDRSALPARVLPAPMTAVASRNGPVQATAIVMVEMPESYPVWWQEIDSPPPAEWVFTFEDFTGDDTAEQWALAAAIFIAQTRRRTAAGPTFAELFTYLLPDTDGIPGPLPRNLEFVQRRRAVAGFRGHTAIEWRRRGMISFDNGVMRSLRVGREFRERSRRRQRARKDALHSRGTEREMISELGDIDADT